MRNVESIKDYLKELVKNGAEPFVAEKFARIEARQGVVGEQGQTILKDGTIERDYTIQADDKGNPQWVVKNVNTPETYPVDHSVFTKNYEIDPDNSDVYRPKGGPKLAIQIPEDITFAPPNWGGATQTIMADGYLLIDPSNPDDIYGNAKDSFESTYEKVSDEKQKAFEQQYSDEHGCVVFNDILVSHVGNMEKIVVPANVDTISDGAFRGNETVKTITLPLDVNFSANVFNGCTNLESAIVTDGTPENTFEVPNPYFSSQEKNNEIPQQDNSIDNNVKNPDVGDER